MVFHMSILRHKSHPLLPHKRRGREPVVSESGCIREGWVASGVFTPFLPPSRRELGNRAPPP